MTRNTCSHFTENAQETAMLAAAERWAWPWGGEALTGQITRYRTTVTRRVKRGRSGAPRVKVRAPVHASRLCGPGKAAYGGHQTLCQPRF